MNTVLKRETHNKRWTHGAPTAEMAEHNKKATAHFIKYCDSSKCIKGNEQSYQANWHENEFCIDCPFNPYNMKEA